MTTRSRLPFVFAVVLLLGGCTPEWWGAWGGSLNSGADPAPSETAGVDTSPGDDPDEANGCPVGAWTLDNESWQSALARLWHEGGAPGADVSVTGRLGLDWSDDGRYVLSADESTTVVDGVIDGATFVQTVRHDGDESGTWSGAGATYVLSADDSSGFTSVVTLSGADGEVVYDQSSVAAEPWSGELAVTCTGGGMTTTVTEESGTLSVDWVRR